MYEATLYFNPFTNRQLCLLTPFGELGGVTALRSVKVIDAYSRNL